MAIIDVVGSKWVKWAWRKTCLSFFSSLLKITSFPVSYLLPESLPNSVLAISLFCVWIICRHLSVFVPTLSFLILPVHSEMSPFSVVGPCL